MPFGVNRIPGKTQPSPRQPPQGKLVGWVSNLAYIAYNSKACMVRTCMFDKYQQQLSLVLLSCKVVVPLIRISHNWKAAWVAKLLIRYG